VEKYLRRKDAIKGFRLKWKLQCASHAKREILVLLRRTLDCLGNHGFTQVDADGVSGGNNRCQYSKEVAGSAAHIENVEPWAKRQRSEELRWRFPGTLQKPGTSSIQEIHKEARIFGPIDLNPRIGERCRRHHRLSQALLPKPG